MMIRVKMLHMALVALKVIAEDEIAEDIRDKANKAISECCIEFLGDNSNYTNNQRKILFNKFIQQHNLYEG